MTADQALSLAGGTLRPEGYRYLKISTEKQGGDQVTEITDLLKSRVGPGDILLVTKLGYSWEGAFFLDGNVSVPGPRALRLDRTVGGVISAPNVLLENPYLPFAVIETTDPRTKARYFLPVDLGKIVAGISDVPLNPDDRLLIFSADDIGFLSSRSVQAVIEGQAEGQFVIHPQAGVGGGAGKLAVPSRLADINSVEPVVCQGLKSLAAVVSRSRSERFSNARLTVNPTKRKVAPSDETCPAVFDRYPNLLPFMLDFVIAVHGEVRLPGIYPVVAGTSLGSLVPVVGGLSPEADLGQIEVTRYTSVEQNSGDQFMRYSIDARSNSLLEVALIPGDIIRFNPRFSERDTGSVLLSGAFKRPGVYVIHKGERLSEVIARAGGITEQAYPIGAVFTRARVRKQEAEAFERAALDLESGLAQAIASGAVAGQETDPQALVLAVRELAGSLRSIEPLGRVVVVADPTILEVRPEFDTVLEPGDRIRMPKRPNHVAVSGEVLNPVSLQFLAGKTVDQYIENAGGMTGAADDDRTFVIFPDGAAQSVAVSSWNFTSVRVPPGSTIVVPRDPKPFDLLSFSVSIADILSKLAITAASLVIIAN
jgi:protein involved in polysaccharide export with SLBB domain